MTRFKDFGKGEGVSTEPLSFKLHDEDFHCVPTIQGKVLLDLAADSASDDGSKAALTIKNFFEKTLQPESFERFSALLDDSEKIVSVETLGEISGWLVGEYTSRPQTGPEQSSIGQ